MKQIPEDFIVEEISKNNYSQKENKYLICKLTKNNLSQLLAIKIIASALNIPLKDIGIAGTKDKHAITYQNISIKTSGKTNQTKEKVEKIVLPNKNNEKRNLSLEVLGFASIPLSLGDHNGNRFTITIRNLSNPNNSVVLKLGLNHNIKEINSSSKDFIFLNYFDEQRFQKNNSQIGFALIKKDWKQAANLLKTNKEVESTLKQYPNQPLKAIKTLTKRELMMYLHAYQSFIFNKTVSRFINQTTNKTSQKIQKYSLGELNFTSQEELIKLNFANSKGLEIKSFKKNQDSLIQVPLPGFLKHKSKNQLINQIQEQILKEENVKHSDFIIKQLSNLSQEGDLRDIIKIAKDLIIKKPETDDLNQDNQKKKVTISFSLNKGSYATMFIKQLIIEKK